MKKIAYAALAFTAPALAFTAPALAFAQGLLNGTEDAQTLFNNVKTDIVNPIITLLALIAFVVFVWGVVDFIWHADDEEKRKTGQQHMIWGIVGLVIIFGANAIISLINNTFGFSQ